MTEYEPPEVTELGEINEVTHAGNVSPVVEDQKRSHRKHRGRGQGKGRDKGRGKGNDKGRGKGNDKGRGKGNDDE